MEEACNNPFETEGGSTFPGTLSQSGKGSKGPFIARKSWGLRKKGSKEGQRGRGRCEIPSKALAREVVDKTRLHAGRGIKVCHRTETGNLEREVG